MTITGKTRGMGAGHKLKSHHRTQRWADKSYKRCHLGNEWKKPFASSSHGKKIITFVLIVGFGRKGHAIGNLFLDYYYFFLGTIMFSNPQTCLRVCNALVLQASL
ncbi:40S ribosomal protein S23 [Citrus sinensis]|uniref:40S ribosomal protein S23 n=1 Tax=Citrus sinensis TaxID=2711 RepID=A0ACB8M6R2_CITSI|nr:40S ribosomal protein S23 [Citrus sinensis]